MATSSSINSSNRSSTQRRPVVTVQRFSEAYVAEHRDEFNVCNLGNESPDDYWEVVNACPTSGWVDKFHNKSGYRTFVIPFDELRWIKQAIQAGSKTAHFPKTFVEELDDCCARFETQFQQLVKDVESSKGQGVFIRSERVSLKSGVHRAGPYSTLRQVLESIVTATCSHGCVKEQDQECRIYLFPWRVMDEENEFRVFVVQNEITAISQQVWSKKNSIWGSLSDHELATRLVYPLLDAYHGHIRDNLLFLNGDYTMDLCFLSDGSLYFIEPNCTGARYAAGSSLFHWEKDAEALVDASSVQLRIVDRD